MRPTTLHQVIPALLGLLGAGVGASTLAACADNPIYLPADTNLEAGMTDAATGMMTESARASLTLPIKLETMTDAVERAALAAKLGVDVPYVKVGDLDVAIDWTIKNLDDTEGVATVELNGANEFFAYDPSLIVLSTDREAPPTPGLEGDVPIHVPALGVVSGVFREDQVQEASIDLDQITRGNVNPFAATLRIDKHAASFQPVTPLMPDVEDYVQTPVGIAVPRAAFAQLVRIDLVFKPTQHMVLEYVVRVRDQRGIVHDLREAAATQAPGELTTFTPMAFAPMAGAPAGP